MKRLDFVKEMQSLQQSLKAKILAQEVKFSTDEKEILERRTKVLDKKSGFDFFVNNYFPHYLRHSSKSALHDYLFNKLPEISQDPQSTAIAIAAPRGEAKSTICTKLFTLWRLLTNKTKFAVIVMDSIDQAYPMLESIKAEIEFNPRIKIDFPEIAGEGRIWQSGIAITKNNLKIQVAGVGKKLRGLTHGAYRPDLVILDDIENDENVRKPEQRDKTSNWINKTIIPLGAAGEKLDIIYIGTVLHYDSVLNRCLNSAGWQSARFKALIKPPLNSDLWDSWEVIAKSAGLEEAIKFYNSNKEKMEEGAIVSWKARPLLELMKIRAKIGREAFDCEYLNDPTASDDAPFSNSLHYYKELPKKLIYFGSLDPSLGKKGAGRDPSAILIGGLEQETGKLYVIEALISRRLPDRIIEDVISLQKKYGCLVWAIEAVQFQEFLRTELIKRGLAKGVPIPARAVIPHSDKALRIESLQPHLKNESILLNVESKTLIDQLRHYPKADHDDGCDALHMLWSLAQSSRPNNKTTAYSYKPINEFNF